MKIFAKGWSMGKDGPGHRRIYYLKGCNLSCKWCASPESINYADELLFYPDRAAGENLDFLCPHGAIADGKLNRKSCSKCSGQECRKFRHRALEWVGENISIPEILREILDCRENWSSFAGVTFGGGEPALQSEELSELLQILKEKNIHTAIESNGVPDGFTELVTNADLVITDLKAATVESFHELTGGDLNKVISHHRFAAEYSKELLIRIPVITTLNDSFEELSGMAEILNTLHRKRLAFTGRPLQVELLRFHHFGQAKYAALGRKYPVENLPQVSSESISFMENMLLKSGIIIVKS